MKTKIDELIERILALPQEEIKVYARAYQQRAEQVGERCRNNVSAKIAMRLQMYLAGDLPSPITTQTKRETT